MSSTVLSARPLRALTHSAEFHADDVMAGAILWSMRCGDVEYRRSRDPVDQDWADVIYDVGAECKVEDVAAWRPDRPVRWWFDHHQVGGAGCRADGIPYAAAGLVWRQFGMDALTVMLLPRDVSAGQDEVTADLTRYVHAAVDVGLIAPIDAADNGYNLVTGYRADTAARPCVISALVSQMNPVWDATPGDDFVNHRYLIAVWWAAEVLRSAVTRAAADWRALVPVRAAYANRQDPRLLVLERGCPWVGPLLGTLKDAEVLYTMFPESGTGWMVRGVPATYPQTFEIRKPFPASWAGLREAEFQAETGVPDAVFCHRNRFIIGARSRAGAEALARMALAAG